MIERIIGEASCPRCGTRVKVRTRRREQGHDTVVIFADCPGCRRENVYGFTTESGMRIWNARLKLTKMLEGDPPKEMRDRIERQLEHLEEIEAQKRMGL